MNPHEEQTIIRWNNQQSGEIHIKLVLNDDVRSQYLKMFCYGLSTLASNVKVTEHVDERSEIPSIEIRQNVRYCGVPEGSQLVTFLEALVPNEPASSFSTDLREQINTINEPVRLSLFISTQCPHCPASVRQLVALASANQMVELEIIDGSLFSELARENDLECVPTTLLGQDFKWSGVTPFEDILEVITNRDPSDFSAGAIERILEERNALKAARMMLDAGRIHPAIFDFMVDERFFLRLGAMTAIEEIIRQDSALAVQIVQPLWERFEEAIEPMQIDILYLLGDAGDADTLPLLESVTAGDYRDHVKETAREAAESIKERHSL